MWREIVCKRILHGITLQVKWLSPELTYIFSRILNPNLPSNLLTLLQFAIMLNRYMNDHPISRRAFLKLAAMSAAGVGLSGWGKYFPAQAAGLLLPEFPKSDRLGRVVVGKVDVKARPDQDSPNNGVLYEDAIVPWMREVVGRKPYYINQRWVETPDGFIYGPYLQPVRNFPNQPVQALQQTDMGSGMWVEVTVPYADVILINKPSSKSWIAARQEQNLPVRVYYGQVFYADTIQVNDQGQVLYRVNPNYFGGVDMFWVPAEALRPILADEVKPISADVEDKRIVVDVLQQSLSCYEGNSEVFYCRVSTGAKYDMYGNPVEKWSTPVGQHKVTRKYISLQMSGGTTGAGYDLPGIGWTSIFATGGVAIHSTFWHYDYGVPRSHGCVNVLPEHAKWIFLWTLPVVSYAAGMNDITVTGDASTPVEVKEG